MDNPKIFAAYLPQYHETPDNNEFWGKGFTDWNGVRKAQPQFEGHIQPRIPLNKRYYDLADPESIRWQAELAREFGIDGFNIYHYWFKDGKQELETPAELLLEHKEINIGYFFTWDNCSWKRTWSNISGNDWAPLVDEKRKSSVTSETKILVEMEYGCEEQWRLHFNYLLKFFNDDRYFKINGMPVFGFMTYTDMKTLEEMGKYWKGLAIEHGFPGLYLITNFSDVHKRMLFDARFLYQPAYSSWGKRMMIESRLRKYLGITVSHKRCPVKYLYEYDTCWKRLIANAKKNKDDTVIFGSFVRYDDTPRRGKNANVIKGETPQKFKKYFSELYQIAREKNKPFVLITAWNEWGEGAYLEPDEQSAYEYLKAIKETVKP